MFTQSPLHRRPFDSKSFGLRWIFVLATTLAFAFNSAQKPPKLTELHSFGGKVTNANGKTGLDGFYPNAVTIDPSGNIFGVTPTGGPTGTFLGSAATGAGMVWEITALGVYKDLHDFGGTVVNADGVNGPDGDYPLNSGGYYLPTAPLLDKNGNLYGTTETGGAHNSGILWEITKAGKYLDLHDFGGTVKNANQTQGRDGDYPNSLLVLDARGNVYGTANNGGPTSAGLLWEFTGGQYLDLHDFGQTVLNASGHSGPDGINPEGFLKLDASGNLYGTTNGGGPFGKTAPTSEGGNLWEFTAAGKYADLHDFGGTVSKLHGPNGPDGYLPNDFVFDSKGNIFGSTSIGGSAAYPMSGYGMIYELTSTGKYTDLHDFGGHITDFEGNVTGDGISPNLGLSMDPQGDLFGTAYGGGPAYTAYDTGGMVWEFTSAQVYKDLHDFGLTVSLADGSKGEDGCAPYFGVSADAAGNLFGSTNFTYTEASQSGWGNLWEITSKGVYLDLKDVELSSSGASAPGSASSFGVDALGNLFGFTQLGTYGGGTLFKLATGDSAPPALSSLAVSPSSVIGGAPAIGTVTLNNPALVGGFKVTLSSSSTEATLPATIMVPGGALSATFPIASKPVIAATSVKFTATAASVSKTAAFELEPSELESVAVSPNAIAGGLSVAGLVTLNGPAPTSGAKVTLSANSTDVTPPQTVTVAPGKYSATFTVKTVGVASTVDATIKATYNGLSKQATMVVDAPTLKALALSEASVIGGNSVVGSVTLTSAAPTGGIKVTLASSSTDVVTPTSVLVPAGAVTKTFAMSTVAVASKVTATLTAKFGTISKAATLTVDPATLASLKLNATTVVGNSATVVSGTVTFTGTAPAAGELVTLTSSDLSVASVPKNVKVLAGKSSATFSVSHFKVTASKTVTLKAVFGSQSLTVQLTVTP